jgi:hypothetical protein
VRQKMNRATVAAVREIALRWPDLTTSEVVALIQRNRVYARFNLETLRDVVLNLSWFDPAYRPPVRRRGKTGPKGVTACSEY